MSNESDDDLAKQRKLVSTIKQLSFALKEVHEKHNSPIAIIGASCRMPGGANSLDAYWDLLISGKDAIVEVPKDRWSLDEYYNPDPDAAGKMYCKWGGFLDTNVADFDAKFFDIVSLEAQSMDPQQRLALEVTWEALEDAGIVADSLKTTNTGVFFGVTTNDYTEIINDGADITAYTNSGISHSVLAGRISFELGLQGPSFVLDTACSSSLVAIHQACRSLREGESNLAIAGGVNLMLTPALTIGFCKGRFLAVDGRCKTFDDAANGYVRGEGCGVIILKRLSDAKRDGDNILAVIRGSAVNQDGASSGLTVPNGPAQEAVIRQALMDGNVKPSEISYVEAHGTGTSLGDPIEIHAIENVLKQGRNIEQELVVASVKTNIGHLESAAGMASVIKVILALNNQQIPKHLHFNKLNHNINLDEDIKLVIPTEAIKWQRDATRRRIAGVSGFAFQGTNAHLIIEEAPVDTNTKEKPKDYVDRSSSVLAISTKSVEALQDLASSYISLLKDNAAFADVAYSANVSRAKFNQRLAVVAKDAKQASERLQAWLDTGGALGVISGEVTTQGTPKVAFLFTGQGSQYVGMGKELYETSPVFKKSLDECASILETNKYLDKPLLSLLWGDDSKLLDETKYTQPCLFALEYALYQLWASWGVTPGAVTGHSVGEYVAATVAGVMSLQDGLSLISKRAALMQALPQNGAMAAINVGQADIEKTLQEYKDVVSIAAINGPISVVISGDKDKVLEIVAIYSKQNIKTNVLKVSHAFHSHLLEPMLEEFGKVLASIKLTEPTITLISNVTGIVVDKSQITTKEYWLKHTREAVQFNQGINTLVASGYTNFVEIGPHPVLLAMAQDCVEESFGDEESKLKWLPSLRREQDVWQETLTSLSGLFISGVDINWKAFDAPYIRQRVQLPTYPFQRKRYWVDVTAHGGFDKRSSNTNHPLLTHRINSAKDDSILFETQISPEHTMVLNEHRVYGVAVLPAVAYLELAQAAAREVTGNNHGYLLEEISFEKAMAVSDGASVIVQVSLSPISNGFEFSVYSRKGSLDADETLTWDLNVTGVISVLEQENVEATSQYNLEELQARSTKNYPSADFFAVTTDAGMSFGPRFSSLEWIWHGDSEVLGKVNLPLEYRHELQEYVLYPPVIDSGLQLLIASLPFKFEKNIAHLPVGIEQMKFYRRPNAASWVYVSWDKDSTSDAKSLRGDIKLLDDTGSIVAEIKGLVAIEAPQQAVLQDVAKDNQNQYYKINWLASKRNEILSKDNAAMRFIILLDEFGVGKELCSELKNIGVTDIFSVTKGDSYKRLSSGNYQINIASSQDYIKLIDELIAKDSTNLSIIINLLPLDCVTLNNDETGLSKLIHNESISYGSSLFIAQALISKIKDIVDPTTVKLVNVTEGVFPVDSKNNDTKSLAQAGVWGLARVLALEAPGLKVKTIDINNTVASNFNNAQAKDLSDEIIYEDNDNQIRLVNGVDRYVARLEMFKLIQADSLPTLLSNEASYWVTGGLGGIGSVLTEWLVQHGARHIVLLSRKEPSVEMHLHIDELNSKYAANIRCYQVDVSNFVLLQEAYNKLNASMPQLRGIIHAAGVLEDNLVAQQTWESFDYVMRPKALGAWNLHYITQELELDFFVLFSSQAAMLGNIGQANYAAANSFLDALAVYRRSIDKNAVSINWGPWLEVGMAATNKYKTDLLAQGINGITTQSGLISLDAVLKDHTDSQIGVFEINWPTYVDNFYGNNYPGYLSSLVQDKIQKKTRQKIGAKSQIIERLQNSQEGQRLKILQEYLLEELKKLLEGKTKANITITSGFMDMGVDSLLAVEFRKILKANFDGYAKIPPTAAFDYPNTVAMSEFILGQLSLIEKDSSTQTAIAIKPSKIKSAANKLNEEIAIIGMSCRLPGGANSLDEYWEVLRNGVDAICEVPKDRWDLDEYYDPDPDVPGKMYSRWGGFLKDVNVSDFDAAFFNITPAEAEAMDPQQRMFLEVCWEALEIAGINPLSLKNTPTAMFVGEGAHDYSYLSFNNFTTVSPYTNSGVASSVTAGRVSYILGLQGPCMSIDTACSSSLVAIHEACNSLHLGESNLAIAGGVSLHLSPALTIGFCKARMLSADGKCKTFDAEANGYSRGEGCGAVILKRMSDALKDGDRILAVIRGSATNQDGASGGLTVPNGPAQQAAIRAALQQSGLQPSQVSYVETHGTGTSLGDPIEVQALGVVYGEGREKSNPITIGSVKTNFGHLEVAAGMASMIKVVLSLQNKQIPKHLNFKTINPMIDLDEIPAVIPTETRDWVIPSGSRIAGMSGFAFQGSNAHVIVEEAPVTKLVRSRVDRPKFILCISGKTPEALRDLVRDYEQLDLDTQKILLGDICYTANVGRMHFEQRLAVVGQNFNEMKESLATWLETGEALGVISGEVTTQGTPKIAFLFTGQGSQYVGMGKELYETNPVFKKYLDECASILETNKYLDKPLLSLLWGDDSKLLDETKYTQPCLFALEYALYQLWASWGVTPGAVTGHSVGEYVAATVAGVMSLQDGLSLISRRAALMQALPQNGAMAAINVGQADIEKTLQEYKDVVSVAAINGPISVVISGDKDKVLEIVAIYSKQNIKTNVLKVSHAFHSHLLEPMLEEFGKVLASIKLTEPSITLISNVTGQVVDKSHITTKEYWLKHTREAVQFNAGINTLVAAGFTNFVEIGPHPVLLAMAQECVEESFGDEESKFKWLPSMRREQSIWGELLASLGVLYVTGIDINWHGFEQDYVRAKVQLPTYPFQRQRYWLDVKNNSDSLRNSGNKTDSSAESILLGRLLDTPELDEIIVLEAYYSTQEQFIDDHRVYNLAVVPGAGHIARILYAAFGVFDHESINIEDIEFQQPVVIEDDSIIKVQLVINSKEDDIYSFEIYSAPMQLDGMHRSDWTKHAEGTFNFKQDHIVENIPPISDIKNRCINELDINVFYNYYDQSNVQYGSSFRWIDKIYTGNNELICYMRHASALDITGNLSLHPGQIDCAFQAIAGLALANGTLKSDGKAGIIQGVGEFKLFGRPAGALVCHIVYKPGVTDNNDRLSADITMYDEYGKLVALANDVTVIKVSQDQISKWLHKEIVKKQSSYYQIEWKEQLLSPAGNTEPKPGVWVLIGEIKNLTKELHNAFIQSNCRIIKAELVAENDEYVKVDSDHYRINCSNLEQYTLLFNDIIQSGVNALDGIIYLNQDEIKPDNDPSDTDIIQGQRFGYGAVLCLARALIANEDKLNVGVLSIITNNAVSALKDEATNPFQSPVWGLARVIELEAPSITYKLFDVDNITDHLQLTKDITKELLSNNSESQVAFRGGVRFVSRLVSSQTLNDVNVQNELIINPDVTYLITGGLGALGRLFAKHLISKGAKHLVLVGRNVASSEVIDEINSMVADGVEIKTIASDISNLDQCKQLISEINQNMPILKGIIHAAGTLDDALVSDQNFDKYLKVIYPKVLGTWNLHLASKNINGKLDFFVMFSSIASIMGNYGQANYAAANRFLDSFAAYRKALGLVATSINWGPWGNLGMAAELNNTTNDLNMVIEPITYDLGTKSFDKILTSSKCQVGVMIIDWQKLQLSGILKQDFYKYVAVHRANPAQVRSDFLNKISGLDKAQRELAVTTLVTQEVAKVLGLNSVQKVDINKPLIDHGLDSLMAVNLRNSIRNILGGDIKLKSTLIFDYPSVTALVGYILQSVGTLLGETVKDSLPVDDKAEKMKLELTQQSKKIDEMSNKDFSSEVENELKNLQKILDNKQDKTDE